MNYQTMTTEDLKKELAQAKIDGVAQNFSNEAWERIHTIERELVSRNALMSIFYSED